MSRPSTSRRDRPAPAADGYDAVVVGGAVAGAATALLLRRFHPGARILVVEELARFPRKVGEATVEVSGFFLQQVLGLEDALDADHLPKHGLRFWFGEDAAAGLAELYELGSSDLGRVPSFQLDRSRLDETLLRRAEAAGCELARPVRVAAWEEGWPASRVTLEGPEGERRVTCRWLLDASGRRAFVARRKRLLERVPQLPTAALWGRWRGVADPDDPELSAAGGVGHGLPPTGDARRRLATNHFCGYGWWCWMIPLADGATSVGLVYDKGLFELPGGGDLEARYRAFVTSRPGLAELLAEAEPCPGDFHAHGNLPYVSRRYAEPGWALVGDAAAFLDPLYSPGLDHAAMSVYATARLVAEELAGKLDAAALEERLARHNERFRRSYRRWLRALYEGKYETLGDPELTACAYMVDTALYYLGVVGPVYADRENLAHPAFGLDNAGARWSYRLLRLLNRRLNRLARFRRATGRYGADTAGDRLLVPSPNLGTGALPMLWVGLKLWGRLEIDYLLRRPFAGRIDLSRPVAESRATLASPRT